MEHTNQKTKTVSKRKKILSISILGTLALAIGFASAGKAQSGEELFTKTCAVCHTIGGGKVIGPDLKGVHTKRKEEWIIKFVKGSQALIKSGDADAKAIFEQFNVVMPDQNLSDAECKSIIAYIGEKSGGELPLASDSSAPKEAAPALALKNAETASPEEILLGKQLFEGSKRFIKGGASCISCHNVNYTGLIAGGVLAKDISNSFSRLGGDAGIKGILGAPPFPAMTAAFKDNPLTDDEIFALTAFLYSADKDQAKVLPKTSDPLLIGGGVGILIIISLIFFIWSVRKKTTVKESIYNRQLKSH